MIRLARIRPGPVFTVGLVVLTEFQIYSETIHAVLQSSVIIAMSKNIINAEIHHGIISELLLDH